MSGKFYGHDSRDQRGYYSKRHRGSNFKKSKGKFRDNNNDSEMMAVVGQSSHHGGRNAPYGVSYVRGRGGRTRYNKMQRFQGNSKIHPSSWAKIVVWHGKKLDKTFLLKSLTEFSETPFVPFNFHYEDNGAAVFYIDDWKTGSSLSKFSHRLTTPDGFKLKITSYSSGPPPMHLDKTVLEKIKVCMSKRYDGMHKKLDLNKFYMDKDLKQAGVYAPLSRYQVLQNVVMIIEENIPQLQCLNLSGNRLNTLSALSTISKKCKYVEELDLSTNSLRYASDLESIKALNLKSLNLNENPLCDSFKDQSTYLSAVRRRFPDISRLDGQILAPSIGFEIEKDIKLPSSQGSNLGNSECKPLILNFLEQYYNIYDSADRQSLLQAYSDNCVMSLTTSNKMKSPFFDYMRVTRNLLLVASPDRRRKLLRQGRLSVVSFLCELPKTQHDRSAFIVDINFVSPQMIKFTVSGLFKEYEKEIDVPQRSPIRSFSRTFLVVPQGTGISIINEMFNLNDPSPEQIKVAFKDPAPTPSPSPVPVTAPVVANNIEVPAVSVDPQQQMIVSFAEKSGMNADFSAKCLLENDWNFDKAAHTFLELKRRGVIPPEAFLK